MALNRIKGWLLYRLADALLALAASNRALARQRKVSEFRRAQASRWFQEYYVCRKLLEESRDPFEINGMLDADPTIQARRAQADAAGEPCGFDRGGHWTGA
jgi:hypothetical protein